jgi:hypothetical protein
MSTQHEETPEVKVPEPTEEQKAEESGQTNQDFVKLVADFTKDVLTTFPEEAEKLNEHLRQIVIADTPTDVDEQHIEAIWAHSSQVYPPRFFDILYQNAEVFDDGFEESVEFLPGMDFKTLWKADISDKTRETIWKYLQLILLRVVSEVSGEHSFGETAKLFEAIDEDALKTKLEATVKDMESLFGDMSAMGGSGEDGEAGEGSEGAREGESAFKSSDLPNASDIHNHLSGLLEGKLGRLAQEIAEETSKDLGAELGDLSDMKSPDQAFRKLFKNPGKLLGLVKKVGGKLEDKIKSGEIKESELLQEAGDFVTKMKDMPGMGNLKTMLGQMGMPGLGKDVKVNMGALNSMMRGAQTRDRLRAKLAKKQQARAQSEIIHSATTTFTIGEKVEKSARRPVPVEANEVVGGVAQGQGQEQSQPASDGSTPASKSKPKKKKNKNRKR